MSSTTGHPSKILRNHLKNSVNHGLGDLPTNVSSREPLNPSIYDLDDAWIFLKCVKKWCLFTQKTYQKADMLYIWKIQDDTLPETNSEFTPEHGWLEYFLVRGGIFMSKAKWMSPILYSLYLWIKIKSRKPWVWPLDFESLNYETPSCWSLENGVVSRLA